MLSTTGRETAIGSAQPARLELKPDQHGPTVLDGGWWPRSEDPATELPDLIRALDERHGRTRRIMLGAADWTASRPRQLVFGAPENGRIVHLGWFATQPAGLLPEGGEVIGFCSWREGLLLPPQLADRISGIQDVADNGLRLVNREPGAEARSLLDRALADAGIEGGLVPGYDTRAAGHLDVAAVIAAGLADAGIASEPAARAYDLGFIPLAEEHFDLVIPAGQVSTREVQGMLKALSSVWLHDQLASLPGYDPGRCGKPIATLPRQR